MWDLYVKVKCRTTKDGRKKCKNTVGKVLLCKVVYYYLKVEQLNIYFVNLRTTPKGKERRRKGGREEEGKKLINHSRDKGIIIKDNLSKRSQEKRRKRTKSR